MANPIDTMNEKKDNWRALNAFKLKIPKAKGTRVMAFNKTNTRMGMKIFFNFDLRAKTNKKGVLILISSKRG